MTNKIARIYCRVSTDMQANEGVSLEAQSAKAKAWCIANDYHVAEIYVDAGLSGKRADNRPELQRALADCTKGEALVVYSLSRLARSTIDTIEISETLNKKKADLVSLQEKLDTTTAAGKMMFQMLAVLAEFERNLVSERTTMALQHKKSKGERVGQIPYGSSVADDGVLLVSDDYQQRVITFVKNCKRKGLSIRATVTELTNKGYKPQGAKWHRTTVARILQGAKRIS
jgi:DNA invertase Pin-like site-specific DNA recombinase